MITQTQCEIKAQELRNFLISKKIYVSMSKIENTCEDHQFSVNPENEDCQGWLVLTDTEMKRAFAERIDTLIDDMIDCNDDISDFFRQYFDAEAFKRDVKMLDGYGPTIASYDGVHHTWGGYNLFRIG